MNLKEIYSGHKTVISFEIFPPDTEIEKLYSELDLLNIYKPALISLTYGAAGKNRGLSIEILEHIKTQLNTEVMPHFSCICNSKTMIEESLLKFKKLGIENILALRGDIPNEKILCVKDFKYANELVEFIRQKTNLSIAVAGYPEGHIESPSLDADINNLKRKIDAGGSVIYTQLFFDNEKFYRYVDLVRRKGISVPIIPGVMPIISIKQIEKMTKLAKIEIPKILEKNIEKYKDSPDDIKKFGIEYGIEQCIDLVENKVKGLHFYTLNKSKATTEILGNIKEKL